MELIKFYAPWCEVCKGMDKVLGKLLPKYPSLKLVAMNVDEPETYDVRVKYKIRTFPAFILLEDDVMIDRVEGAFSYDQGVNWLDDNLGITLEKERRGELPEIKNETTR